jgi:N-acetylglucosaminyldiphosphoundecaprenol N-acetyl-beta-D-mannosaminyltransferase
VSDVTSQQQPRVEVLGLPLDIVTMAAATDRIAQFVREKGFHLVITLGVEMVMNARQHEGFRRVAQGADLLTPDSIGVVWAARRAGYKEFQRAPGVEMVEHLAARGAREGWRFFLLGSKPGVAQEAAAQLCARHAGLQVVGTADGYFKSDDAVIRVVAESRADVLLVALGSPRQELWAASHGERLGVAVAIGVGGSLDVLAGRTQRAPRWMQRLSIEWLYRLYLEPRRAMRMLALPHFALLVLLGRKR